MDYEQFKSDFTEAIKEASYERGMALNFTEQTVEKVNTTYDALTVMPEGSNVGMNINIQNFYENCENGASFEEAVSRAMGMIEQGLDNAPQFNLEAFENYDLLKEKLSMEVIGIAGNESILDRVPHHNMEDMAVVYRYVVDDSPDRGATVLITNDMVERFGITPEQLHEDALNNAPDFRPAVVKGMTEVMFDMMGPEAAAMGIPMVEPEDELMFVATTPDKNHGAGVIAYQDFMDQAAEKLGGDFFILPSSIHEVLLVKDDGSKTYQDLEAMVKEVNETQLSPEEKLTDNVYHYDSKDHVFELAQKFEERMQDKAIDGSEKGKEKDSLLSDLAEKKQVAAATPKKETIAPPTKNKGGDAI